MLVDSWYDAYLGVVVLVRIFDGILAQGRPHPHDADRRRSTASTASAPSAPACCRPTRSAPARSASSPPRSSRSATPASATPSPTSARAPPTPLPGFQPSIPVVFCGLFPVDAADFEALRDAIEKLQLNDATFTSEMETSAALGFGFRCGFLGLLHLEVIRERLEREFDLDLDHHRPLGRLPRLQDRRHHARAAQPRRHARPGPHRPHRGAAHQGDDPRPRRLPRRRPEALPGPPRRPARPHLRRLPRHGRLRPAAERGGLRLLRPPEVGDQGLRLLRLPPHRLPGGRPRQDADPRQRRAGRRPLHHGPPRPRRRSAAAPWSRS